MKAIRILLIFVFFTIALRAETDPSIRYTLWLDLYRGEPVRFSEMKEDLLQVRILYLGETHTLKRHHQLQYTFLKMLLEADRKVVLCLEQIEAKDQPAVDQFNQQQIDFEALAEAIQWKTQWRNYEDYRALVTLANENNIPLLALNADAKIIRKVGRQGLAGIDPAERAQLPEAIELNDPDYRKLLDQLLMVHAAFSEDMLGKIFEAQVARDEMMAERIANYLSQTGQEDTIALVVAGSGHLSRGFGIPSRVRRRLPDFNDRIILSTVSEDLVLDEESKAQIREITITHEDLTAFDRPVANYLHITTLVPEPPSAP